MTHGSIDNKDDDNDNKATDIKIFQRKKYMFKLMNIKFYYES